MANLPSFKKEPDAKMRKKKETRPLSRHVPLVTIERLERLSLKMELSDTDILNMAVRKLHDEQFPEAAKKGEQKNRPR